MEEALARRIRRPMGGGAFIRETIDRRKGVQGSVDALPFKVGYFIGA